MINNKSIGTRALFKRLGSYKQHLYKQFNLNERELYYSICIKPDSKICDRAAQLIGYRGWYNQGRNKENKKKNLIKNKLVIKKLKRNHRKNTKPIRNKIENFVRFILNNSNLIKGPDLIFLYIFTNYIYWNSLNKDFNLN